MIPGLLAPALLRRLRVGLLAILLVCGQAAMLAHAADHAGDGGEPPHVCLLCVAGHNLDGAAPAASVPALPALAGACPAPLAAAPFAAARFLAGARARAPPAA
ncbi:hypothetical protein [Azospira restricta]|uniref:DUF2946 domain-containing protein n=1 Tax=Azospira restricta TaxID=404405 RepID=A0A974SR14_9RHOO|nr:hypothetical protein [Azospira restricta]QRJ64829.1 hypothetical protein IWH25_05645 [Azospira restricta]